MVAVTHQGSPPVPCRRLITKADVYYELGGHRVAVLLDGRVHDAPAVRAEDAVKRTNLKAAGWSVVEINWSDLDDGIEALRRCLGLRSAKLSSSTRVRSHECAQRLGLLHRARTVGKR